MSQAIRLSAAARRALLQIKSLLAQMDDEMQNRSQVRDVEVLTKTLSLAVLQLLAHDDQTAILELDRVLRNGRSLETSSGRLFRCAVCGTDYPVTREGHVCPAIQTIREKYLGFPAAQTFATPRKTAARKHTHARPGIVVP